MTPKEIADLRALWASVHDHGPEHAARSAIDALQALPRILDALERETAGAAAMREALGQISRNTNDCVAQATADAALSSEAGAALLARLQLAEEQAASFGADASRLQGENGRLVAQLALDGPMAAAARVYEEAYRVEPPAPDERALLLTLVREQKGGAK